MTSSVQEANTELRLEFVQTLDFLCRKGGVSSGENASVTLCDGSVQTGSLQAVDKHLENFVLKDFTTPLGKIKSALVRTTDVNCISIPTKNLLEESEK